LPKGGVFVVVVVCLVAGFMLGRLSASAPGGVPVASGPTEAERPLNPADGEADEPDAMQRMTKAEADLKQAQAEIRRLKQEKADTEARLADMERAALNARSLLEDARKRTEDLEWQVRGGRPGGGGG
jgi:hypothetical protein